MLQADRSLIDKRAKNEATGEVKSLVGNLQGQRMGDRAARAAPAELEERKRKRAKKEAAATSKKAKAMVGSVLNEQLDLNLKYRPKTQETQHSYELILSYITEFLGSQPQDILMGAADEVLEILKDESIMVKNKRGEVAGLLGRRLTDEEFTRLVALGSKITDYDEQDEDVGEDNADDEQQGVALIFDRDDEEEEGDDLQEGDDDDLDVVRDDNGEAEEEGDEEGEGEGDEGVLRANLNTDEGKRASDEVDPREIDAFWLQRQLGQFSDDAVENKKLAETALSVLQDAKDDRECENSLVKALGFERFELVKVLRKNRYSVLYCTLLARASNKAERQTVEAKMRSSEELAPILRRLQEGDGDDKAAAAKARRDAARAERLDADAEAMDVDRHAPKVVALDDLSFAQGGHTMANKKCHLPAGSTRTQHKGWEEVHVPALKAKPPRDGEKHVEIKDLPDWAQLAFKGFKKLNRVQSRLHGCAFGSDENVLLCAPTGAGKTNVALLTMLREIGNNRDAETGAIDLKSFKIIYIAPMKSLVAEMTGSFRKRLEPYNISVEELTGDQSLTREQIYNTNVIVCTPEKWDVITRKGGYEGIVSLIIIDEIHLLHDERGPVLESVLARTTRQVEATQEPCRLVGLSATLPNYQDVATLLRVDPAKGLFFFDNSFRPCPLQQTYIGITERKAIKRFQLMNDIVYDKVMASAGKHQVLIFTHSRKDTAKTAHMLREMCIERDSIGAFMREDSASVEVLRECVASKDGVKDNDLRELLPYGFAIHHAGMTRADRTLVEELFGDRHVQVLVSTATLAWGVNLPAHTVIIKGTQVYSSEKGGWTELSFMDVMQMLGRAGRPQYDDFGEGIVITTHNELQYYLSLLNEQLPVESQYVAKLPDNLNAEIVAGACPGAGQTREGPGRQSSGSQPLCARR